MCQGVSGPSVASTTLAGGRDPVSKAVDRYPQYMVVSV